MSASSPSLSGASAGYSPNQPTTGAGGSVARSGSGMGIANGNGNGHSLSHERDREYVHDHGHDDVEREHQYPGQASASIPLSTLINNNNPSYASPSPLPPPNTSTAIGGGGGGGQASSTMMDDNWFMPWICSTPTTPAFPGYQGTGVSAAGGQWNIPRALLPGDWEPPVEQVDDGGGRGSAGAGAGAGAGNMWADSLAAVTDHTGLLHPQHHAQHHSNPPLQQPHTGQGQGQGQGQSYNRHQQSTIPDRRGEMYSSHPLAIPALTTGTATPGMPFGIDSTAHQRPRHGSNARESFTSTRSGGALVSGKVVAPLQVIDIEEIVSWSHVLSFLSLYHEHL